MCSSQSRRKREDSHSSCQSEQYHLEKKRRKDETIINTFLMKGITALRRSNFCPYHICSTGSTRRDFRRFTLFQQKLFCSLALSYLYHKKYDNSLTNNETWPKVTKQKNIFNFGLCIKTIKIKIKNLIK